MTQKRGVLLSVSDKRGLVDLARALEAKGFPLLSTGGTAKAIRVANIAVTEVSEYTGSPEVMDGRVKTLHPRVHGGILMRDTDEDRAQLEQLGGAPIDLVIVNLYPFEATVAAGKPHDVIIENIDIGGPAMIRSAAKNHNRVAVVVDPADYEDLIKVIEADGFPDLAFRERLAAKAFTHTAKYDLMIARYVSKGETDGMIGTLVRTPKYGENACQTPAGLYKTDDADPLATHRFEVVAGQPPSYNNECDLDRELQTGTHIAAAFNTHGDLAIAVKHGNPCGASCFYDPWEGANREHHIDILKKTVDGDHRAIFGGLVITTFEIDEELADILLTHGMKSGRRILDGIIAPSFTSGAIQQLKRKEDKCRFVVNSALRKLTRDSLDRRDRFRFVRGGFLKQPNYTYVPPKEIFHAQHAALEEKKVLGTDFLDGMLAWAVGCTSNSNTITLVKNGQLIGNGVGQQDRVGCCELAIKRARDAGHDVKGAVAYSDSFFPFEDGPKALIEAGVVAIFATSGSVRDGIVKKTCDDAGVRFYQVPDAEGRGFFGH